MTTGPQAFSLKYMPFLLFSGEEKKFFFHLFFFSLFSCLTVAV